MGSNRSQGTNVLILKSLIEILNLLPDEAV